MIYLVPYTESTHPFYEEHNPLHTQTHEQVIFIHKLYTKNDPPVS